MRKLVIIKLVVVFCLLVGISNVSGNEVEDLKAQIRILTERIDQLEAQLQKIEGTSRGFAQPRQNSWNPFEEMERMQRHFDQNFDHSFGGSFFRSPLSRRQWSSPNLFSQPDGYDGSFDLQETDDGYILKFDLSGLDQDKIDVDIDRRSITIKGERSAQSEKNDPQSFFRSQEFSSFSKTVPVPFDADTGNVKTQRQGDMLIVELPRK